jgi:tetratricopeptide (TPR) repeat protein
MMSTAKMMDRREKIAAWNAIGVAQAKAGLRDAAQSRFSSALHVAYQSDWEDSDRVEERASELAAIAEARVAAGDEEAADENFARAFEMATGLDDDYRQPRALHAIAGAQAGAGRYADALATLERIQDGSQESALKEIAVIQAERGLGEDAVRTAEMINKSKEVHLPEIAEALLEAGDREHFKRLLLPCAHDPESAGKMFLLLLKAYPEQAASVFDRWSRA